MDHSATTPVRHEVVDLVNHAMVTEFGNPSSLHEMGVGAEALLKTAREQLASVLQVPAAEIYFTSGGTEANNLALRGAARALHRSGKHIITSAVEHSSVLSTVRDLAGDGFDLTVVPVDKEGRVDPADVQAALRDDTILVSIMLVNNELGTVQPAAAIGEITAARRGSGRFPLYHVDAVQALGKMPVRPRELKVDLLTLSGHKIHGPKGARALYARRGVRLLPMLTGGEQEQGLRPGTENVPAIAGMGLAAQLAETERPQVTEKLWDLNRRLLAHIKEALPWAHINSPTDPEGAVPHIVNVGFPGVRGETLVHALAEEGIYVSTGSACHSRQARISHVLEAAGLPAPVAQGSIRISMGPFTTQEHVEALAAALARLAPDLAALAAPTGGGGAH